MLGMKDNNYCCIPRKTVLITKEMLFFSSETQANEDKNMEDKPAGVEAIGEGGEKGDIVPGESVVFASLEVVLVVFVQHIPSLNPKNVESLTGTELVLSEDTTHLISSALSIMTSLPSLCSPAGII